MRGTCTTAIPPSLELHSCYSLLEGASHPGALLERAEALGYRHIALADTNALYAAVPFYEAARERGIVPIIGAQIKTKTARAVVLARNLNGYRRISHLVTKRRLDDDFDLESALAECGGDVYILSPTVGLLAKLAGTAPPERLFAQLKAPPNTDGDAAKVADFAAGKAIGLVAAPPVYFATPERHRIHRVLRAVACNTVLARLGTKDTAASDAYMKGPAEIVEMFSSCPEALDAAARIAGDCNLELELGRPIFPPFELPEGETAYSHLAKLAFKGVAERYKVITPEVMKRLTHELSVIRKLGFCEYFLIVWDIVRFAHEKGFPALGRGSAANSIVAYALGITIVDPIRFDLYFERFMNLSRTDCPDIDLDVAWNNRDAVLDYVYDRYGAGRVAMISTHPTFRARSGFRDVARTFGLGMEEVNALASRLPQYTAASIREAVATSPEARDFPIDVEPYRTIVEVAESIDGFPRHLSIHPGGIVIAPGRLDDYTPLERAAKGIIITQYDMGPIERLGLVKIDILGQRALAAVYDAANQVERTSGVRIRLETLPDGDAATAELARTGTVMGCFQIESPGMRNLLVMMRARNRMDLIIGLSLIRPGPASSGMKDHFVKRRLGLEPVEHITPQFDEVLGHTYGVMLYQEDILKVARAVAGFSLEQADALRKAISKKRSLERIRKLRASFFAGARARGVDPDAAERVWDLIANFAGYSYCKAHAATYGHISYAAVYLKAHWPGIYLAAVLNNEAGFYERREYVEEARRLGVEILGPDVNESDVLFRADGRSLRIGLGYVKGIRRATIESIVRERAKGLFKSLDDFLARTRAGRVETRYLILAGAFDPMGSRPRLLLQLELTMSGSGRKAASGGALFDMPGEMSLPDVPDYVRTRKIALENELMGMSFSGHPIELFERELASERLTASSEIRRHRGRRVKVAGWLVAARRVLTAAGEHMKFITIEDTCGTMEVVLFPREYKRYGHLIRSYGPYIVSGKVEDQHGAITITCERLRVAHPDRPVAQGMPAIVCVPNAQA